MDDTISETPPKKRRLDGEDDRSSQSQVGASPDYLDGLRDSDLDETVATLPINGGHELDETVATLPINGGTKLGTRLNGDFRAASPSVRSGNVSRASPYPGAKVSIDLTRTSPEPFFVHNPHLTALDGQEDAPASSSGLHTVPIPANLQQTQLTQPLHGQRSTQDTQNFVRAGSSDSVEEVQVLASSPRRSSPPSLKTLSHRPSPGAVRQTTERPRPKGTALLSTGRPNSLQPPARPGRLASLFAPPGTAFRAPIIQRGPARAEPITIDSDDDDERMPYVGGSSGEDDPSHNIKPTELKRRGGSNYDKPSQHDFSSFVKKFQSPSRTWYEKALAGPDITFNDISDYVLRNKVQRLKDILPQTPTKVLHFALIEARGNADAATELITAINEEPIDLTSPQASENDQLGGSPTLQKPKPRAKVEIDRSKKVSLQEKYGKNKAPGPTKAEPRAERPPRRKLIRPTKKAPLPSSDVESHAGSPPTSAAEEVVHIDEDVDEDVDSGVDATSSNGLLEFFNTCTAAQLMDLANIAETLATHIISHRPFKSYRQIRKIDDPNATRKRKRMTAGEKVMEIAEEMWEGYQAVDQLVENCQDLSKPVREEMEKWGVNIFGADKAGQVNMLSLNGHQKPVKDSGIATPATTATKSSASEGEENGPIPTPGKRRKSSAPRYFPQPSLMNAGAVLKEYQVVGINWLMLLFENHLSGILADDMGLGKTCQVIAFLAELKRRGIDGPHVVIVPSSTVENWLRECDVFCEALAVQAYHGSQKKRYEELQPDILENSYNVIVTSYDIAKKPEDRKFLKKLNPVVCVFDEAHMLKNTQSAQYRELMRIRCDFRLLLTGTPLQNNLRELVSLLGFLMPAVFSEHRDALESIFRHTAKTTTASADGTDSHAALLSQTRIAKAKAMLAPFVLRRKKAQVVDLPPKTRRVQYCDMTASQAALYASEHARLVAALQQPKGARKEQENALMILRKAAIHPWLFRRDYTDAMITEMTDAFLAKNPSRMRALVYDDLAVSSDAQLDKLLDPALSHEPSAAATLGHFRLANRGWMNSGKVAALVQLLQDYMAAGHRTLVFSQFVLVLDLLERVLEDHGIRFTRLDGSTPTDERLDLIDQFNRGDPSAASTASPAAPASTPSSSDSGSPPAAIPVFLLSTKAGGAGINLAAATRVVIFDASFNPQDDVQAENRAHRVGQTRAVEVVRLVTRGTVEELILGLGRTKLKLGERVAGEEEEEEADEADEAGGGEMEGQKMEETGRKRVIEMMREGFVKETEKEMAEG